MKKTLFVLLMSLTALAAFAQQKSSIDDIRSGWAKKTITGVKDGNILTLVTAFNNVWRTMPATYLLKHPVSNGDGDDSYDIVVDKPNGYVSAYELGDDGESFEACVWRRDNGHKLFAYVFQRMYGLSVHQIILFYDYDPAKKTLTPEPNELTRFQSSYDHPNGPSGLVVTYHLPQQGKSVKVQEYLMNWYLSIEHVYEWDGMKPRFSRVNIEKMEDICAPYNELYGEYEGSDFTKYTLHDFDDDDEPELWLSSENGEYQGIFSIVRGETDLIAGTYFKTSFSFWDYTICVAGGCGTGCYNAEYIVLEKSKIAHKFEDYQEWNFQKDRMDHTYTLDERELSQKEGEKWLNSLNGGRQLKPVFRPLEAVR